MVIVRRAKGVRTRTCVEVLQEIRVSTGTGVETEKGIGMSVDEFKKKMREEKSKKYRMSDTLFVGVRRQVFGDYEMIDLGTASGSICYSEKLIALAEKENTTAFDIAHPYVRIAKIQFTELSSVDRTEEFKRERKREYEGR